MTDPADDDLAITFKLPRNAFAVGERYKILLDVTCSAGPDGLLLEPSGASMLSLIEGDPTSTEHLDRTEPEGAPV